VWYFEMQDFQRAFIEFALQNQVLRFGKFTLKSGRRSPYFFNSGLFNSGANLSRLGDFYARAIVASGIEYDMLFGPAYKGIPLASAAAISLALRYDKDVPFGFDRKEAKAHGEGGRTLGAPLTGQVLIIDDVISVGTSVTAAVEIIRAAHATPVGVMIALDRQERGYSSIAVEDRGERSAIEEVEQNHGLRVMSLITLDHLIEYLQGSPAMAKDLERIKTYRALYGVKG
jgi:orotate phosphoribosyltransferase